MIKLSTLDGSFNGKNALIGSSKDYIYIGLEVYQYSAAEGPLGEKIFYPLFSMDDFTIIDCGDVQPTDFSAYYIFGNYGPRLSALI